MVLDKERIHVKEKTERQIAGRQAGKKKIVVLSTISTSMVDDFSDGSD